MPTLSGELAANRRLDDWMVHDLNREPALSYADASFDAVLNAVSAQYLLDPVGLATVLDRKN